MASKRRDGAGPSALSDLKPNPKNPRTISEGQLSRLAKALTEFGPLDGFIFNRRSGQLVSGHQRAKVLPADARIVRDKTYPKPTPQGTVAEGRIEIVGERFTYREVDWPKDKETAALIAANQHGGEFDEGLLSEQLLSLPEGFDMELTGFDHDDLLDLGVVEQPAIDAAPRIEEANELQKKWRTDRGQLWSVGEHRLLCGDSTKAEAVAQLLEHRKPLLCVTDPPYGVHYNPQWRTEAAKNGHLNYPARRTGKVDNDDRSNWESAWKLFPGDVIYSWHPPGATSLDHAKALQDSGFIIRIQIIWAKSNVPIGRGDYHVRHEPCWYAVRKGRPSGRTNDRSQTTLWEIALDRNVAGGHSTQKPLECMARPIRNHISEEIYDPFVGSGTAIVAAENLGRKCFAMETNPGYVAVTLQRMQDAFGITGKLIT